MEKANTNSSTTGNNELNEPVIIAQVPKTIIPTTDEDRISALKSLLVSAGWKIILEVLEGNIKYLESIVLDRKDLYTGAIIDDEKEIESARLKRALSVELKDLPQTLINKVRGISKTEEEENDDPYPQTQKDLDKMESLEESKEEKE
jgi:hypothetical protein